MINSIVKDILQYRACVQLDKPVLGNWNGGAKSYFEFRPEREHTEGCPAVRWGSFAANYWITVNVGKSVKSHLAAVRRWLKCGKNARISFEKS